MQDGNSALHVAVIRGKIEVVKKLIDLPVNPSLKNKVCDVCEGCLCGPMVMRVSCLMYASEAVHDCIALSP